MSYSKIENEEYVPNEEVVELYPRLPSRKQDDEEDRPVPSAPEQQEVEQDEPVQHQQQQQEQQDEYYDSAPQPSAPPQIRDDQYPSTSYSQLHSTPAQQPQQPRAAIPVAIPVNNVRTVLTPPLSELELHDRIWLRQTDFQASRYIHQAWMFLKPNFCIFILAQIVWAVIIFAYFILGGRIANRLVPNPYAYDDDPEVHELRSSPETWWKRFAILSIIGLIFSVFIGVQMMSSWFIAVFNAIKSNRHVLFRDFFSAFSCQHYFRLAGLSVVVSILHTLLSFLYLIPGLWFSLATMFTIPLHTEHSFLSICKSIRFSSRIIHRNFCSVLGFVICLVLFQVVGLLCFIIGLFVTLPLAHISLCYAYHDLIGINGMAVQAPQQMQQISVQPVQSAHRV